ncbi:MAG TPA: RtcB family protein [Candidatus Bathyarchaeia archaeon]|nr:RtcB family protein [Candidatus Bathyarchaeia archaeon]
MDDDKIQHNDLMKIDDYTYEIDRTYRADMQVPARVFMNEHMMEDILADRALWQLVNVATLPGIQKAVFAMPDIHQGYGFPIGGVAASALDQGGVISPGGIGYDINCGVRLLRVSMEKKEILSRLEKLATVLFKKVPSGVGRGGKVVFKAHELDFFLTHGAREMVKRGYGTDSDVEFCEEKGCMSTADPDMVSEKAKNRGSDQLGTLGSGNHFLEIQYVDTIFDASAAHVFGLKEGQVTVMIHCGSRGLGHQTCTDYVRVMMDKLPEWGYQLPDRELVYAPFSSVQGQNYFAAMAASANYAWANRHLIGHWVREGFEEIFGADVHLTLVYDVSHNMGKVEKHVMNGKERSFIVHRKGATRAFGPKRPELPLQYQQIGQPVLIPGTMGTASYVMVGTEKSMDIAFGSSCHGAGRRLSRVKAKRTIRGSELRQELEQRGIIIRSDSDPGLAEEAPEAYKDIEDVVEVTHGAGLAEKVARLKPLAVVKGG